MSADHVRLEAEGATTRLGSLLLRGAFFNMLGWATPLLLALVSIPLIVSMLGVDAYGLFSILSVVAGYLGALNTPAIEGGVRFIADAHAKEDWSRLRRSALASLTLTGACAAVGAAAMAAGAGFLVDAFKVPAPLVAPSRVAFRLAGVALFTSALTASLGGVLAGVRRFGLLNLLAVITRTLTTAMILAALWMGGGLVGAVAAQVGAGLVSLVAYASCVGTVLARTPRGTITHWGKDDWRSLISFSGVLLLANIASVLGLQIDRAVVGVTLGTAAVAYYAIPARLTDCLIGLVGSLTEALYPLSSEAAAAARLGELRGLYLRVARYLTWFAAFMAAVLLVIARDLLTLWVGADIADRSWRVLAILAVTLIWRTPASVAYRVSSGLGRADIGMKAAWTMLIANTTLIILLTPPLGLTGAALALLLGMIPTATAYDVVVQRSLLKQRVWRRSAAIYLKPLAALGVAALLGAAIPLPPSWVALGLKTLAVVVAFALGVMTLDRAVFADTRDLAVRLVRLAGSGRRPDSTGVD